MRLLKRLIPTATILCGMVAVCLVALLASARPAQNDAPKASAKAVALLPTVTQVYTVAPNVLAVVIEAGRVQPSQLTPYVAQTGDTRKETKDDKSVNGLGMVRLVRGGREIGWLIGSKRDTLVTDETLEGTPLNAAPLALPSAWTVTTGENGKPVTPDAVFRKTAPLDWAQPSQGFALRHTFYLKLSQELKSGASYAVRLSSGANDVGDFPRPFTVDPARVRSEAVHSSQIGWRPDDPVKRAFLSAWLGTGGAFAYPGSLPFSLVDDATSRTVYRGKTVLARKAGDTEGLFKPNSPNRAKTDVWQMDFGDFQTPGTYRVVVEGVGSGYPFPIGDTKGNPWEIAFQTQMRGFYHQRSGSAHGPPYTKFTHPRDLHPKDGVPVYATTYSALDGGNAFSGLWKNKTATQLPNAWGGYHDAGDWNPRHTDHLQATLLQLELFSLFPDYFARLRWNLPPSHNLPDLLNEAEWGLRLFHELQTPSGGIPHGIETTGDPYDGEVSWKQSQAQMAFAPDLRSSYVYAACAARFARLAQPYNKPLAAAYGQSAQKAAQWAEADWTARTLEARKKLPWETGDERNLAALELYALTQNAKWHALFKQTTCLVRSTDRLFVWESHAQYAAAFGYACLPERLTDPALRKAAVAGTTREADLALDYAKNNAWGLTTPDTYKPLFLGFFSVPDAQELIRAHVLTGDEKYLAGTLAASAFASGANPANRTYTTGVGQNPPRNPLHLDSRRSGQPAPDGLTVYGNLDFVNWTDSFWTWPLTYFLNTVCEPPAKDWPITEAYFDVFLYPAMNEFTMNQTMGPNAYVWGYLAARPVRKKETR